MDGLCPEGVGYPRFGIPFARIDTFQFVRDSPNMPKKQVHLHDLPLLLNKKFLFQLALIQHLTIAPDSFQVIE